MPKKPNKLNPTWVNMGKTAERWHEEPFYNSRQWRKDSHAHLAANPLCEECLRNGKVSEAKISDHIIPIKKGGDIWDWKNRQALCKSCHYSKSAKDK